MQWTTRRSFTTRSTHHLRGAGDADADPPEAAAVAVTIIERTSAIDAAEEFELGTLRPGAFVRRRELDDVGIAPAELDGGTLAYGDRTWRIEAHAPRPGPDSEASGEILMHLSETRMPDLREEILARLISIAAEVPGIATAGRNRVALSESARPAIIVLDADEAAEEEERASRPGYAPQLQWERLMIEPGTDTGHARMSDADLESLLARAAEEGARRALTDVGLGGKDAALTIHDMRSLLECISFVRRTAVQTAVHVITTGILIALLAGIAVKLRIFGSEPWRDRATPASTAGMRDGGDRREAHAPQQ